MTPMTSDLTQQVFILHMNSWIEFLSLSFKRLIFKINIHCDLPFQQPTSGTHLGQSSGRYTEFGGINFWCSQNGLILLN